MMKLVKCDMCGSEYVECATIYSTIGVTNYILCKYCRTEVRDYIAFKRYRQELRAEGKGGYDK